MEAEDLDGFSNRPIGASKSSVTFIPGKPRKIVDEKKQRDTDIREEVLSVAFHPHEPLVAFGTSSSKVKVYSLVDHRVVAILPRIGKVTSLSFSSDGRFLASAHTADPHLVKSMRNPDTNRVESRFKVRPNCPIATSDISDR